MADRSPPLLRDATPDSGPAAVRAAQLLGAEPPLSPPPEWKERVRERVLLAPLPPSRPGLSSLRPWLAGLVGLTLGVLAPLALRAALHAPGGQPFPARPAATAGSPAARTTAATKPATMADKADRGAALASPATPPAGALAPLALSPLAAGTAGGPRSEAGHRRRGLSGAPPADATAEETGAALMLAARAALARDHDPTRAGILAEEYLEQFPAGPLAEEALFTQLSAAAALGDPSTAVLAARYLESYPAGRFRDRAAGLRPVR